MIQYRASHGYNFINLYSVELISPAALIKFMTTAMIMRFTRCISWN